MQRHILRQMNRVVDRYQAARQKNLQRPLVEWLALSPVETSQDDFQRGGVTLLRRYEIGTVLSWEIRCQQWSKDRVELGGAGQGIRKFL